MKCRHCKEEVSFWATVCPHCYGKLGDPGDRIFVWLLFGGWIITPIMWLIKMAFKNFFVFIILLIILCLLGHIV